jgi:hypothetical protein
MRRQLSAAPPALWPGGKRSGLALQDHHIVDKSRRNPEMLRRGTVRMPLFNKCNNTLTQFYRMWFAHRHSPSMSKENHKLRDWGILNHIKRNML